MIFIVSVIKFYYLFELISFLKWKLKQNILPFLFFVLLSNFSTFKDLFTLLLII